MLGIVWNNGLRVIKQVLDWFQEAKEIDHVHRILDYSEHGIAKDFLNEFDIVVGGNNTPTTPSITVETGVAYDLDGKRISIDNAAISFNSSNPSHTTDDGLGNPIPTPRSTGSLNVPLTVNTNNHVYIRFLQTIDDSVFTLQKVTNAKQFYKRTDGYEIVVNTTGILPSVNSLKLGNVNLTGSGVVSPSTIFKTGRIYTRLLPYRVKTTTVKSDLSDKTPTYAVGEQAIFIDEHVKAVGTGTVTPNNPHGIAPLDIGLSSADTVEDHQKFFHSNGLVGNSTSLTSSLYTFITAVEPGLDFLTVRALTTAEHANVDGASITDIDIGTDVIVNFLISDPSGTWYIYVDKLTRTVEKTQVNLISSPDATKLLLYTVVWTYPGDLGLGDGDLSALVDRRNFGTIAPREVQVSGTYEMTGVRLRDGSLSTPSLSFISEPGVGFYRVSTETLGYSANGDLSLTLNANGLYGVNGTVALPSFSFISDPDTGIYRSATNEIGFAANGIATAFMGTTGLVIAGSRNILNQDGTAALPVYSFFSDTDTGIYRPGSNAMGFSTAGVERVRLTNTGQLGIGLTSLASNVYLHILKDDNPILRVQQDAAVAGGATVWVNATGGAGNFATVRVHSAAVWSGTTTDTLFIGPQDKSSVYFQISNAQALGLNGTAALPALSFISDPDTGIYSSSSNTFNVSTGGVNRWQVDSSGSFVSASGSNGSVLLADGTGAAPAIAFRDDTDTGFYRELTNAIAVAAGAKKTARFYETTASNSVFQALTGIFCGADPAEMRQVMVVKRSFTNNVSTTLLDSLGTGGLVFLYAISGGNRVYSLAMVGSFSGAVVDISSDNFGSGSGSGAVFYTNTGTVVNATLIGGVGTWTVTAYYLQLLVP